MDKMLGCEILGDVGAVEQAMDEMLGCGTDVGCRTVHGHEVGVWDRCGV